MRFRTMLFVSGFMLPLCVFGQHAVARDAPVVVEYYGMKNCGDDFSIQQNLSDIVHEYPSAIVVNCTMYKEGEAENETLINAFCKQRAKRYAKALKIRFKPMVIINGRWDAALRNIAPAFKLGQAQDRVVPLSISRDAEKLEIALPDDVNDQAGHLVLYIYKLSEGLNYDIQDSSSFPMSSATASVLNTQVEKDDLIVRPVISMHQIGAWEGYVQNVVYDLSEVISEQDLARNDLGYVVVLHQGQDLGPALAVGEIMPEAERLQTMPHSYPAYHDVRDDSEILKDPDQ